MEARKTVIKYRQIQEIIEDPKIDNDDDAVFAYNALEKIAQIQAEITAPIFFEEGKKAGIREVMGWLDEHDVIGFDYDTSNDKVLRQNMCDWADKLKEWGIE